MTPIRATGEIEEHLAGVREALDMTSDEQVRANLLETQRSLREELAAAWQRLDDERNDIIGIGAPEPSDYPDPMLEP